MIALLNANALHIPLADKSVHCSVSSPPYWGLRKYSGEQTTKWGEVRYSPMAGLPEIVIPPMVADLGLEPTPEAFVGHIVEIYRDVWRVMRDDGTVFLNFGDSYGTGGGGNTHGGPKSGLKNDGKKESSRIKTVTNSASVMESQFPKNEINTGLKPKDLIGIPWRVAFALQADGWYLRSEITWVKRAPMPESVTDRPTSATEKVFLLSKQPRYFYDNESVKEPSVYPNDDRKARSAEDQKRMPTDSVAGIRPGSATYPTRNMRNYLILGPDPFNGAHFATYPRDLVRPCIRAGTSERGACPVCGAPWVRVVERTAMIIDRSERTHELGRTRSSGTMIEPPTSNTTGWRPTCTHDAAPVPCVILDPFAGSGTTGLVARALGRRFVGLDLSYTYLHDIARKRLDLDALDEWTNGVDAQDSDMGGLPLFEVTQ